MNKFVYFMAVGLAFTVLQVATVSAQTSLHTPAITGDDTHSTSGEDCAAMSTPELVAACWDRKSSHADGAHGGMAAGTTAMCGGVPCTTAGATSGGAAPDCAALPTPAEVAACWESNTAQGGGGDGCAAEETPALVAACVARKTAGGN